MTLSLFRGAGPETLIDENGSLVELFRGWLVDSTLYRLMLASELPIPEEYKVPGTVNRTQKTHRLSCAFGPPGLRYRYAGQVKVTHPWLPELEALLPKVRAAVGEELNFALCNVYPDGRAQLGWHSDKDEDRIPGTAIASLSFGSTRMFQLRRMDQERVEHVVRLGHGDLLVMKGETQRDWVHRVPRQESVTEPRVNFTFRRVAG